LPFCWWDASRSLQTVVRFTPTPSLDSTVYIFEEKNVMPMQRAERFFQAKVASWRDRAAPVVDQPVVVSGGGRAERRWPGEAR